jgi:hypothetical protein
MGFQPTGAGYILATINRAIPAKYAASAMNANISQNN